MGIVACSSLAVRADAAVVFSDNFDSASEGQQLTSRSPDVGASWGLINGTDANHIIQSAVNNGGKALQQTRGASGGAAVRGVADFSTGIATPNTVVTAKIDLNLAGNGGTASCDFGYQSSHDPYFFVHPDGTYRLTDGNGNFSNTGLTASTNGWDTLEWVLTYGADSGGQLPGTFSFFITTPSMARTEVASGLNDGLTDTGSILRLLPSNQTNNTAIYWDNAAISIAEIPEPTGFAFLVAAVPAMIRHRRKLA